MEPFLHARAVVHTRDEDDLKKFKHFAAVERLRSSPEWRGFAKEGNPAKMPLYNALVMSKLYWLAEASTPPWHALTLRKIAERWERLFAGCQREPFRDQTLCVDRRRPLRALCHSAARPRAAP